MDGQALHPTPTIAPELDLLCRCLAAGRLAHGDTSLARRLAEGGDTLVDLASCANNHLLAPSLHVALERSGHGAMLPSDFGDYLAQLHALNHTRNIHIRRQTVEICDAFGDIDIRPVVLKGGAHLFDDAFADPGSRMLKDLDLLVPADRLGDAVSALRAIGYRIEDEGEPWTYQFRAMYRDGELAPVELHSAVGEQRHMLSASDAMKAAVGHPTDNTLNLAWLNPTHRVLHAIVHAEIQDRAFELGHVPLKTLVEVVQLDRHLASAIDWRSLHAVLGDVLDGHLALARMLLGMPERLPPTRKAYRHASWRMRATRRPRRARMIDRWADLSHPLKRSNIDYLYGTQNSAVARNAWRVAHGFRLISRRARHHFPGSSRPTPCMHSSSGVPSTSRRPLGS